MKKLFLVPCLMAFLVITSCNREEDLAVTPQETQQDSPLITLVYNGKEYVETSQNLKSRDYDNPELRDVFENPGLAIFFNFKNINKLFVFDSYNELKRYTGIGGNKNARSNSCTGQGKVIVYENTNYDVNNGSYRSFGVTSNATTSVPNLFNVCDDGACVNLDNKISSLKIVNNPSSCPDLIVEFFDLTNYQNPPGTVFVGQADPGTTSQLADLDNIDANDKISSFKAYFD